MESVETDFAAMTQLVNSMGTLMTTVVAPMNTTDLSQSKSAKDMNEKLAQIAREMTPDSRAIGETGRALRDKANEVDVHIRNLVRLAKSDDGAAMTGSVRQLLENAKTALAPTGVVADQMDKLLVSMAPAEVASTLMRNALKPMRASIVAFSDSVRVLQKWEPELLA